jgi:hypothetical protein
MSTTAIDSMLSLLAKSYDKPSCEEKVAPKIVKVKVAKATKTAPIAQPANTAPAPTYSLPNGGEIDAAEFRRRMNRAMDRSARIEAIAAYVGYNPTENYDKQEVDALSRARRECRPLAVDPNEPFKGSKVAASVAGYAAGMPDSKLRQIQNLLGRERLATDASKELLVIINDPSRAEEHEGASIRLAVEAERIKQIRKDLAALGELGIYQDRLPKRKRSEYIHNQRRNHGRHPAFASVRSCGSSTGPVAYCHVSVCARIRGSARDRQGIEDS